MSNKESNTNTTRGDGTNSSSSELFSLLDETPITEGWLIEMGFKRAESPRGTAYADHFERDGLNVWEFNGQEVWLFEDCDRIEMRTRGELRMLARLLEINL